MMHFTIISMAVLLIATPLALASAAVHHVTLQV